MNGNIIVETVGQYGPVSIFVSRDSGTIWTNTGATHTTYMDFISFHPQKSNIVYAGKYRFDNIRTSETYETLTKHIKDIYKGNGDVVYSYNGNTIYKSVNKGATWTAPYPSLNLPSGIHISQIAVDPTNENRIYAAVRGRGIYIIDNTAASGGTVVLKNKGLDPDQFGVISTYVITVDPNNNNIIYAGAHAGGERPWEWHFSINRQRGYLGKY